MSLTPSQDWRVEIAKARCVVRDQVTFGEILDTGRSVPTQMAAELIEEAGAVAMGARGIGLKFRENLARARVELRTLSRLIRGIGNPYG
jgi:hypothetical protein